MKGKKKPLGLPSTLQAELGLGLGGGGGGGSMMGSRPGGHGMHNKKRKGAAPLSRKEKRKQERIEKKQRKAGGSKRPLDDQAEASMQQANGGASNKRARTEMGSASASQQPPECKSLGLLARAKAARGLKGGAGGKEGTETKKKGKKKAVVEKPKDPYILAEEEEIKYLERKLGLRGKDKAKREEKLFRDLMKYEGFDDSICDLIRATDRISELVTTTTTAPKTKGSSSKDKKEKGSEAKGAMKASAAAGKWGGEEQADDEGAFSSEREEEDWGSEDEEDEERRNEGGVPDFLDSDTDWGEGMEGDWDSLAPLEVEYEDAELGEEDEEEEGEEGEEEEGESGSEEDEEGSEADSGSGSGSGSQEDGEDGEDRESAEVAKYAYRPVAGEDIYGRPTGAAAGGAEGGKYVPPHLRRRGGAQGEEEEDTKSEEYVRLRKLVNGLANRLSEANLEPCIRDARALYGSHSSQRVNALLTDTMLRLCVSPAQHMKGLIPAYAALIAGCHLSGGGGVGAFALERVCHEYDAKRKELAAAAPGSDAEEGVAKELGNLVLLLTHLYAFGVVACGLVYGLVRELVAGMGERDVELLLLLLRAAGAQMRGDDPAALKDIVLAVQERAAQVEREKPEAITSARVRHMLETINDLKNNKRRQAQLQDQERLTRLRKLVNHARSAHRGAMGGETLHVTWEDLRQSDERGRWWRVGASWVGKQAAEDAGGSGKGEEEGKEKKKGKGKKGEESLQERMARLAAKQRMNTDVRRAIFCAIMAATDYEDAFERIVRLNLTDQQEREVVRVLVDCAGQEAHYNPYYAYLAGRLCEFQDRHKFTLQLTFWDIFKLLDDGSTLSARRRSNLARTLAHLILKGWLSLAVVKVVDVTSLGPGGTHFFRSLFLALLGEDEAEEESEEEDREREEQLLGAVQRVGASKDPLALAELLAAFVQRMVLVKGEGNVSPKARKRAKALVKLLDKLSVTKFMAAGSAPTPDYD